MLLFPYRVDVEWASVSDLTAGDIYYGTNPEHAPEGVYAVGLDSETCRFFRGTDPAPESDRTVIIGGSEVPAPFTCAAEGAFDLIASTFYFLSGWQEFHTVPRDEHGRVRFEDSMQYRFKSPHTPYVDAYRLFLHHRLKKNGNSLSQKEWGGRSWVFCPTHDIDYIRKWRPGILRREILHRTVLNRTNETPAGRVRRARKAVYGLLSGNDPFRDAIRRIRSEVVRRSGTATFFIKTVARGPHDVRYAPDNSFLREQYAQLRKAGFEIALHPGYHAYNHAGYLREEKNILAGASGVHADTVRTHYLRYDPALCPGVFEEAEFTLDSTLGWTSQEGFRYATCHPFLLYDLTKDKALEIWEMPLIVMESTLFNRRGLDLSQAIDHTISLMETCRRYGGVFVGLWHNTLWDEDEYPGWGEHFTTALDKAQDTGGLISSLRGALQAWE